MGGLTSRRRHASLVLHDHRRPGPGLRALEQVQHQVLGQTGTNFNPSSNKPSRRSCSWSRADLGPEASTITIDGFASGNDVSRRARVQRQAVPDGDRDDRWPRHDRPRLPARQGTPGGRPRTGSSTSSRTTTGVPRAVPIRRSRTADNSFTIMSTTGNVTGQGVPASFPSIYIGNNGDTQNKNDPPKGSYTTQPSDGLPKRSARSPVGDDDRRVQQDQRRLQRHLRHLAGRRAEPDLRATATR